MPHARAPRPIGFHHRVATGVKLAGSLRWSCQLFGIAASDVPNRAIGSTQMNIQARFETARGSAVREVAAIGRILADLVRTVQLIESDITAEERRAGVFDRSDVKYP